MTIDRNTDKKHYLSETKFEKVVEHNANRGEILLRMFIISYLIWIVYCFGNDGAWMALLILNAIFVIGTLWIEEYFEREVYWRKIK